MRSLVLFRGRAYGSLRFERLQRHRCWQEMEPPDNVPCKIESLDVLSIPIDAEFPLVSSSDAGIWIAKGRAANTGRSRNGIGDIPDLAIVEGVVLQ
jgi:hypothetical protein